jgi:6-phospho-beta-glucosidase
VKIALLGGSTPFTVPLVDEVGARLTQPGRLVLYGRDGTALEAVAAYARSVLEPLGWRVGAEQVLDAALEGADVVVHQVRYGDLAGRGDDEALALALGVPADETLGPAALQAALRAAPEVRRTAAEVRRRCPGATVLNLTNPLSVTTAVFAAAGVEVLGLCELPAATQRRAASLLGMDPGTVEWSYTGLNHRGFLHHLRRDGRDPLGELALALEDRSALGVLGREISELQALPLKYFGLFAGWAPHGAGRAARLSAVRANALRELTENPERRPPSLRGRPTPWYAESVVPVLGALVDGQPTGTVVNAADADGLVRERRVILAAGSCRPLPSPVPPAPAGEWLARFERHERAVLAAVADPTAPALRAACAADPLLPEDRVEDAVRRLSFATGARAGPR